MWSKETLAKIKQVTGLVPPDGFSEAADVARARLPSLFQNPDPPDACDPMFRDFPDTMAGTPVDLIAEGFLPFWQENEHWDVVMIGCKDPFAGCIAASGNLLTEAGGLISASVEHFFRDLAEGIRDEEFPMLTSVIEAMSYSGRFTAAAEARADTLIRQDRKSSENRIKFSFFGGMSATMAMDLLDADSMFECEAACWRLAGLKSREAVPKLKQLAALGDAQHHRAAGKAIEKITASPWAPH